jgi:hypothetical protein
MHLLPNFYFYQIFLQYLDLNSGLHLEPLHQPIFVWGIFKIGSCGINCPGLASNRDPPDFCLLSS